jgi:hypothetical protein
VKVKSFEASKKVFSPFKSSPMVSNIGYNAILRLAANLFLLLKLLPVNLFEIVVCSDLLGNSLGDGDISSLAFSKVTFENFLL